MGVVYEAQDTRLPRSVAIKFLRPALSMDGAALRRFKREARLASAINHPNICTILDVEEVDGRSFIAMELLQGASLKDRLSEPLPLAELLDIAVQVADALAAAHDEGIIHRDIKPGNVFLTESGLVKLLDFGLAKHFPAHDDGVQITDNLTAPGVVTGTLHYMAPEQLDDSASPDYRCDLFSFGALLYEMAAGVRPFEASPQHALISAIRFRPHVPLRRLAPHIPPELERIVDTLLAKQPEQRYQSAHTLRAELQALGTTPTELKRPAAPIRARGPRSDDSAATLRAALVDRYALGGELGRGGMSTVYAADDLRHRRRVAVKMLDPTLGAMLGAERFLAEIQITAGLQHPNLVPLFDSGDAGGLLYYVMPLVEGASLRARLKREPQLPVDEAVRMIATIAGALDYAHRQGIVHRDLKPENILLQDGQPLVADFGIALAVARAGGPDLTATGTTLGTPRYMSPEQALGEANVDARSDIYSLASVLYESLVGDPPFTGSSAQAVIAKVISEVPSSARTLRSAIPLHVDAALSRALAKRPADRFASAREFADALLATPVARAPVARWRRPVGASVGTAAVVALASVAWMKSRPPAASADITVHPYRNLIDQSQFGAVTMTPDGRSLVYTGAADAGRPLMILRLDQRVPTAIPGTEGGMKPFVSPDGKRLAYIVDGRLKFAALDGASKREANGWRYGNGAWVGDSVVIAEVGFSLPLYKHSTAAGGASTPLTALDTAHGETGHVAPLVLPGTRSVVFTVRKRLGQGLVTGSLAIASLDPALLSTSPHVLLADSARRAIAFVAPWLLYTSTDGKSIMASRLDVEQKKFLGAPIAVLSDQYGNLETASLADDGRLLYLRRPRTNSIVFVDSSGAIRPGLMNPEGSFMNPRLSPDGKRIAVQVSSATGEDIWLYDIKSGTPTRLTTSGKALLPSWTPDGLRILFMIGGVRGIMSQPVNAATGEIVPGTMSAFAPIATSDGQSVVFHRRTRGESNSKLWSVPLHGVGAPRRLTNDPVSAALMPAVSPDGRWVAYVLESESRRKEVYVRSFSDSGPAVKVSDGVGTEPAWSPDGRRIYYRGNGVLMAATVSASNTRAPALTVTSPTQQFKDASDNTMPHRNYDVLPDGGFLMVAPSATGNPEAVLVLNWLTRLRELLALER